jgi:crotonobetainyl-CoA:carnitine CoA-transferase CaiB-like acyl-CoA transferase
MRDLPRSGSMQWLDVAVAGLVALFGIALAVVVATGGGSVVEVALVIVVFVFAELRWLRTSFALDVLRGRK